MLSTATTFWAPPRQHRAPGPRQARGLATWAALRPLPPAQPPWLTALASLYHPQPHTHTLQCASGLLSGTSCQQVPQGSRRCAARAWPLGGETTHHRLAAPAQGQQPGAPCPPAATGVELCDTAQHALVHAAVVQAPRPHQHTPCPLRTSSRVHTLLCPGCWLLAATPCMSVAAQRPCTHDM